MQRLLKLDQLKLSTTTKNLFYNKNTIDNFHSGRQKRLKRVTNAQQKKGLSRRESQYISHQQHFKKMKNFASSTDARMVGVANQYFLNAPDRSWKSLFSKKRTKNYSLVENMMEFYSEKYPQLTNSEIVEVLIRPESTIDRLIKDNELPGIQDKDVLIESFQKYLQNQNKIKQFSNRNLLNYYSYDFEKSMPKGFGPDTMMEGTEFSIEEHLGDYIKEYIEMLNAYKHYCWESGMISGLEFIDPEKLNEVYEIYKIGYNTITRINLHAEEQAKNLFHEMLLGFKHNYDHKIHKQLIDHSGIGECSDNLFFN